MRRCFCSAWFCIWRRKSAGGQWQTELIANLQTATSQTWYERPFGRPYGFCVAGRTLATGLAEYQARPGNISKADYVLMNFGANDVTALPSEATWTNNLTTFVEELHTYNPTAKIYIMRPWRRNYLTECNSLATWIGNVVTAHSAYCFVGPDERVFLEGGDDGASYTIDGTHPNSAGYTLTAQEWQAVMGF